MEEGAEQRFLAIQEAYEILTGKQRGKELDGHWSQQQQDGWDFHDWCGGFPTAGWVSTSGWVGCPQLVGFVKQDVWDFHGWLDFPYWMGEGSTIDAKGFPQLCKSIPTTGGI